MALNLVVAAITLWNTAYLDRALRAYQTSTYRTSRPWDGSTSPSPAPTLGRDRQHRGAVSDRSASKQAAWSLKSLSGPFLPTCPVWPNGFEFESKIKIKCCVLTVREPLLNRFSLPDTRLEVRLCVGPAAPSRLLEPNPLRRLPTAGVFDRYE
jgi:hypothetical protein